eukprot:scaffold300170_cov30-Tisochrysis_lutea.AAC.1
MVFVSDTASGMSSGTARRLLLRSRDGRRRALVMTGGGAGEAPLLLAIEAAGVASRVEGMSNGSSGSMGLCLRRPILPLGREGVT